MGNVEASPGRREAYETYEGGSPEREAEVFAQLARDLMLVQAKNKASSGAPRVQRAFHAKAVLGVQNARLVLREDLPFDLRHGCFQPGAEYQVTVRLSNASPVHQPDSVKDLHGVALRIDGGCGQVHDLLMTNFPVSPAANAREFVAMAKAVAGRRSALSRTLAVVVKLPPQVGVRTAVRIIRNLQVSVRPVQSLALETYWSRGSILWGDAGPVRYLLRPLPVPSVPRSAASGDDGLRADLIRRLAVGDIAFELAVQRFVSEERTPVEDTSRAWTDQDAPPIPVASLVIPSQDLSTAEAQLVASRVEQLAFNPWNTCESLRPLGNLNRARKVAYAASSEHRLGYRFVTVEPPHEAIAGAVAGSSFRLLNWVVAWYRLPWRLGELNLVYLRRQLRRHNLFDPQPVEAPPRAEAPPPPPPEDVRTQRTYDGQFNDLASPGMGAVGAPFGRNLPPRPGQPDAPDPIRVSRELLQRQQFIPAPSLNLLAAAWIQFQVHDWVNHARYAVGERSIDIPITDGRSWRNTVDGPLEAVMRIAENRESGNTVSHWWDGSELYGVEKSVAMSLREPGGGARLHLEDEDKYLPEDPGSHSGFNDSWWLALSAMHTLFAREHNAVCEALSRDYPKMTEERRYQTARLIVSALVAKIHTVEWTPAILATKTLAAGVNTSWRGGSKDWLSRMGLQLFDAQSLRGISRTLPDHHGVPFSLTEEFITVYRMHPLIPDDYVLADHGTGEVLASVGFNDIQGANAEPMMRKIGLRNTLYSLSIANPGAVTLHNFPRALQRFERDGEVIDLSVVDIVRTRRRGVPRYNDFRAGLHKRRIRRFEDLTTDPDTLCRLKCLYSSVDEIDTVVGLLAENPPAGFGFSDTAFRIFLLMASRRLQSDRFLTVDFRPEIYTPLGMEWIDRNGMASVLLRHCPELANVVRSGPAAFAPWRPVPTQPDGGAVGSV
jgi:Animal haem peroxidase